ncbi:MAG: hypothetical protein KY468_11305 [Armatimonadetes bacterium]|nr:hypothetical protein [Armatimonadota bacterium]
MGLGWQGLSIPLPEDWNLAAFSGDWGSGYVRAEGPGDSALELKWKHEKSSPSLKGLLKSYLKQLHKAAGRKKSEVSLKEKPKALPSVPQGSGVSQTFSWQSGGVYGIGAVWHCLECRRIVLVQVTALSEMTANALARRIIPKIGDHPEGDLCRWSVYDFDFTVPKEFRLEKQSLRSGHLSMEFRHKGRTVVLERYGPANVLLKRDRLSDWATAVKPIFDRLKPYKYKKETVEGEPGHDAVRLSGRRKAVKDLLRRAGLWMIRMQPPDALRARVWNCEPSNRIVMVMVEARPRDVEALTDRIAAGVRCHTGEPERDSAAS